MPGEMPKAFRFWSSTTSTCLQNLQVIIEESALGQGNHTDVSTGAAVEVEGVLVESPGKGQRWESKQPRYAWWERGGENAETYPLQKKRHTRSEFFQERCPYCGLAPINMVHSCASARKVLSLCIPF